MMKLYTQNNPEGIEILQEKRADAALWMDYCEWAGILSDGSQYVIKGNCDYHGWRYALFVEGERTALLNPRSPIGKPSAM